VVVVVVAVVFFTAVVFVTLVVVALVILAVTFVVISTKISTLQWLRHHRSGQRRCCPCCPLSLH
jgi:hypothetical protein